MRNQGRVLVGILVIAAGLVFLLGGLFDLDVGALCLPTALILLGVWLLLRPRLAGPDTALHATILGPVRREGVWQLTDEEIWMFVGDVRLDLTEAVIPAGETSVRVFGFVVDAKLTVPDGVAVAVSSTAFVSSIRLLDQKRERFVVPVQVCSADYEAAERKILVETFGFVSDVKAKRPVS